jgi:DNA polymerase-3 subunit chi
MTAPEFWFYHLESQPLEAVLPLLLEKTLERGWRASVRFSTPEQLDTIDSALWTYREGSFLPHGTARDGHAARQPVFLTLDAANPNGAQALFLLETAAESEPQRFARIVRLFGNADEEARALARSEWKTAKEAGFEVSYWQQDASGAWKKAA